MIKLSRTQLAKLRGRDPTRVSRALLPKLSDGKYDLEDPAVWEWATGPTVERALRNQKIQDKKNIEFEDLEGLDLNDKLTKARGEYVELQTKKLELDVAVKAKDLYPAEQVALFVGHVDSGLRTNLLPIGNRIARGDNKLRDRIDKEVAKGIRKTKDNLIAQLRNNEKRLVKILEEESD